MKLQIDASCHLLNAYTKLQMYVQIIRGRWGKFQKSKRAQNAKIAEKCFSEKQNLRQDTYIWVIWTKVFKYVSLYEVKIEKKNFFKLLFAV